MSGTQPGLFGNPASIAAAAAGVCASLLVLWAMRGLPLGGMLLWLSPLPLMAAGFAFGPRTVIYATGLAAAVVVLSAPFAGFLIFLAVLGIPAMAITALATPGARLELALPLAFLGIWPVMVLMLLAFFVPDLEAEMREAVEQGVRRMGLPMADGMVAQIAQVKAAAAGFWLALLMLGNGFAAHRLVTRQGLALQPAPLAEDVRLPSWYTPLPLVAGAAWLAIGGAVAFSALLLLCIPFFVLGVVQVHLRLRGRPARKAFLAGFYVLMLIFLQFMAPLMVGLGLFEHLRRRVAPPTT